MFVSTESVQIVSRDLMSFYEFLSFLCNMLSNIRNVELLLI